MASSFLGLPELAWGGACLVLSLLSLVLWPSRVKATGLASPVVRWGHSLVWALLAICLFGRTWAPALGAALNILPLLAGLTYAAFVLAVIGSASRRA